MSMAVVQPLAIESQPSDVRGVDTDGKNNLIISTTFIDGICHVLSRYGDEIWYLSGGATNRSAGARKLDFSEMPEPFRETVKALFYRYVRRGRRLQRRPGPRALVHLFDDLVIFLRHADRLGAKCVSEVSPIMCTVYVQSCQKTKYGKAAAAKTIANKMVAVEALYELSQFTSDPMPRHPWPDGLSVVVNAAKADAALARKSGGKTPLIPDDIFCRLFQHATSLIERADDLLAIREALSGIAEAGGTAHHVLMKKRACAKSMGFSGSLPELELLCNEIRTACYVVVASLSGCRNHELAFLRAGACYKTVDRDGDEFWWMRSQSTKTYEGHTEWMIPEAAVTAIRVMERWAAPFQKVLLAEIDRRRSDDPTDREIAEAQKHIGAIFVGIDRRTMQVRTLTNTSWQVALSSYTRRLDVRWRLATHQFRRTFANYAARSQFGDLRYLKQHFKHWSFDMTLGYAMNELQEVSLYSEVFDELADLKESVIDGLLQDDAPLAGGLGKRLVAWRGDRDVVLFPTHAAMVKGVSDGIALRSNGHAWCTADKGIDCIGNGGLERSRCSDCDHAVIGRIHARVYQGIHHHLLSLRDCQDIGEGGRARVERDIARCVEVLESLGAPLYSEVTE